MRYGYHEYSKNYRELKINPYFTLKAGERDEYETQRIMELNPTHVEMLYKLGYRNLWKQRVSEKKVEFLKKHAKEIEKELGKLITVEELSKAYTLKEKGIGLKKIHEVLYFIRVFSVFLDEYNFDGKAKQVINGNQKGTKTKDVTKIMRMVNVAKEHGIEHVKTCRGVCYYFDMDFEAFIFKGLKERESVIEEWKEKKREFRLKNQREYRRRLREQKEKEKMRRISFDDFCQKNKVVFEDLGKENFYIKEINGIQIEEALWVNEISIAEFYEEKKELYEFEKNNKIIVEKKEKEFILVSVNDKIINKTIYSDKTKAIKRTYEDFLYEEKVKKTTLEEATEKLKEIKVDRFIFTPLKTMKDLQEIQDEMQLCLIRNEYHKRIKGRKVVLYIAREENQDKTKGEVIEFKIEKNEITPVQIRGKENKNTENYEAIKEIAKTLKYEALQIQQ
ncbi:MAG: hypothetical protein EOM19_02125 [Candidatus Moranbacteria bacterium]|nr:hypothetical protein [Candidatus Moranbacteria bacterium]